VKADRPAWGLQVPALPRVPQAAPLRSMPRYLIFPDKNIDIYIYKRFLRIDATWFFKTRKQSVGTANERSRGKSNVGGGAIPQGAAQSARSTQVAPRGQRTVGAQFREQLAELMEVLEVTESRYVRCVKPNKTQSPDTFDSFLVLEQLRYSGVFEAVAIRRQGFPFRFTHRQFVYQYSVINKKDTKYRSRKDDYAGLAQEILDNSPQKQFKDVRIGKTQVLYRAREYKILLLLRNLALERLVPWIQARMRSYIARKLLRACRECDKIFQSAMDDENDIDSLESAFADAKEVGGGSSCNPPPPTHTHTHSHTHCD